jgi:response regulator RpfG family c-di-GMP phosphodiesterase
MARMLALADVYEALTADRPYRGPMGAGDALAIMAKDRGTAFDPVLFDVVESLALDGAFAAVADAGRGFDLPVPDFGRDLSRDAA